MKKLRNIFLALSALGGTLLLTGCEKLILLNPKGMIAKDEKDLLITAVCLMLIIVLPVILITLLVAFRYRASNRSAKYDPHFTHSTTLETLWWGLPIIIILILATITWKTTHDLDPYKPISVPGKKPITIEAISLNWRWLFIYPDQHIAMINTLEFPVNTPVNFYVTSDAPMNSLVIDQLAGQIYSMAGMRTQLHLVADQTGNYQGRSISFSGNGFSGMNFNATVVNDKAFNTWVAQVQKSKSVLNWQSYQKLVPDSEDTNAYYFKLGDANLFDEVIMKYVGPDMAQSMGMPTNKTSKSK